MKIGIKKLDNYHNSVELPTYAKLGDAGADIRACVGDKQSITLLPNTRAAIPTGLAFEIPEGYELQVRPRSGISLTTNLLVCNSPGTIDSGYKGEVKIILGNFGDKPYTIHNGVRIAQLVLAPIIQAEFYEVNDLTTSDRGNKGFGSTGVE